MGGGTQEGYSFFYNQSERRRTEKAFLELASPHFRSLGEDDEIRRRILIPLVRAEFRRRELLRAKPQTHGEALRELGMIK